MKVTTAKSVLMLFSLVIVGLFSVNLCYAKIDPKTAAVVWLFDEGKDDTLKDLTGNGNDGTLHGLKWSDGKLGKAIEFNGAGDIVECDGSESLNIKNAITITAWVKWLESAVKEMILKNNNSNNYVGSYEMFQSGSQVAFRLVKGGSLITPVSAKTLSLNVWHHIAGVWDGSTMKIFIDGVEDAATSDVAAPIDVTTGKLTLGAWGDGQYPYKGLLDEVGIFNVALDKNDIQGIMNQGLGLATGLTPVSPMSKLTVTWSAIKAK